MFFVFEVTLNLIRFHLQFTLLHIFTTLFTDKTNGFSIFFDHQRSQIYKKGPLHRHPRKSQKFRPIFLLHFLFKLLYQTMIFRAAGLHPLFRDLRQDPLWCLNFDQISPPIRTFAHIYNSF